MKAIKLNDDDFSCLIEDAIFYDDDTYSCIGGDSIKGFTITPKENIDKIEENGWSALYPMFEVDNDKFTALAGETSWGGTGFIAIQDNLSNSFLWLIHLSSMNNPKAISIENNTVRVTTDLNHPHGLEFIIPIQSPENFKIENLQLTKSKFHLLSCRWFKSLLNPS